MVVFHAMETIGYHIKVVLLPLLAFGVLFGCSNDGSYYENTPQKILHPYSVTDEVFDLSSYISELDVIPLVNDTLAFKGITKLLISDKYFFLTGGIAFSASLEGNDLRMLGNVGRGPGEYLSIKDIALSPDGKELWCVELYNSVLRYNTEDGIFLGKVSISKDIGYVKGIIPISPTEFALYSPNPTSGYCLKIYDFDGRVKKSGMPYSQFNFDMGFSVPTTVSDGTTYAISPESKMPTVVYRQGQPDMLLVFDFGRKAVPDKYYSLSQENPWNNLGEMFEQDCLKQVSSVFFPNNDICFRVFGKDSSSWNYYMNKDGTRGIRWQSIGVMAPPICPIASAEGYVYFPYDDYGFLSLEEEKDPLKKIVIGKYGLPEHPGKTYIIKARFDVK